MSAVAPQAATDMLGRLASLQWSAVVRRGSTLVNIACNDPTFLDHAASKEWAVCLNDEWEMKVVLLDPAGQSDARWVVLKNGKTFHASSGNDGWILCDRESRKVLAFLKSGPRTAVDVLGRVLQYCK